jgi:low affinity Fe/Cu permease
MEQLWIAFAVLVVINFILFLLIGVLMHRVAAIEDRTTCLTDPDEYTNMLVGLEVEAKRRSRAERKRMIEEQQYEGDDPMTELSSIMRRPPHG